MNFVFMHVHMYVYAVITILWTSEPFLYIVIIHYDLGQFLNIKYNIIIRT